MLRISNQGVILAFALIVLLLGVNAGITYRNTVSLHDEASAVQGTYNTIEAIDEALVAVKEIEDGHRSYLFTGDENYLQPYRDGIEKLKARVESVKLLVGNSAEMKARLADFDVVIAQSLDQIAGALDARGKEFGIDAPADPQRLEAGRRAAEAILALGRELVAEQKARLAARSTAADDTFNTAVLSGMGTAAASIVLVAVAVILIRRNIQARTRAARELEEQHDLLQTTLASIAEGIVVTDAAGRVTYMNPVAEVMTGTTPSSALGRPLGDVMQMQSDPEVRRLDAQSSIGAAASPAPFRQILISTDGAKREIDERAAPLLDRKGVRIGTVRAVRDVTALHANVRLIESLLSSEKQNASRLRQIAAAASTLNSAHSRDTVLDVLREEARTILGYGDAVVVLGPQTTPARDAVLSVPLVGRGGQTLGKVELVHPQRPDASQDESALAILQQLSHIASVALENARLYEELREGDRRKDEFLATLAHELRNPLAPVRNSVQIMRSPSADSSDRERALGSIERQVTLLVRLVDDLLDVSRITRGKVALQLQAVELADIVAQALDVSRAVIEASGNTLAVEMPSTSVLIEADAVRLAQVISNLLANASKYTDRGGHILLACQVSDSQIVIRVRDDGMGIPEEMLPRIFDMFWQVDHALERAQGGLGIGLTLVRQLVELHGGNVEAFSEGPGKGSEFTIRLPRKEVSLRKAVPVAPPTSASPDRSRNPQRIVVVDDNVDSAESLALLLRLQGHEVSTAHDGLSAVELVLRQKPSLVLLDIGLPSLNGYDVARTLRAQLGSAIVLVAMTGWGQAEDRRRSQEAGFDHDLAKPVDQAPLQKILAELGACPA
ncbi:MAG TPA: ATP-binding protein [Planctomycetota bacterium]|nr:ATP-binding protein [Planctomycetota bacterium]